jgi:hypothetical protein
MVEFFWIFVLTSLYLGKSIVWLILRVHCKGRVSIEREVLKNMTMFMKFLASEQNVFIIYGFFPFFILIFLSLMEPGRGFEMFM